MPMTHAPMTHASMTHASTSGTCQLRVNGDCPAYSRQRYHLWFIMPATSPASCQRSQAAYQRACTGSSARVVMNWAQPPPPPPPPPSPPPPSPPPSPPPPPPLPSISLTLLTFFAFGVRPVSFTHSHGFPSPAGPTGRLDRPPACCS